MARITKRGIDKELDENLLKILLKEIKKCRKTSDFEVILNKLFTTEEQIIFKKRLAVLLYAGEKMATNKISKSLDISRTTISFIKRGLKNLPKNEIKLGRPPSRGDYSLKLKQPNLLPGYSSRDRWSFLRRPHF